MATAANKYKPVLAFAGVGWIGRSRLKSVVEKDLATIALITDPSDDCIEQALQIAPGSRTTHNFYDAINDKSIDGVVIATPSAMHMQQTVAALEKGKAVFCQKPLGRDAGEVLSSVNAAKQYNKLLGVDFSYRYTSAFQSILAVIRSGELGQIYAVDLKFHNAYGPDKPWFYNVAQSGGGCVLDLGIHLVDLMLYALDFPLVVDCKSSLFSKGQPLNGGNKVEDYANVQMELANNISARLACSWNLPAGREAVIEASFYGINGGVSLKNVNGSFYDFEGLRYYGTRTEKLTLPPDDWGGRAIINWVQELSGSAAFNEEATDFIRSAEVVDKIYKRT